MKIKIFSIFISSMLFIVAVLSGISTVATFLKKSDLNKSETPNSYIIEAVPYVSQEINLFCAFASFTMMLNYFEGIDLTLQEVLFYSGVGYSLIYPGFNDERIPLDGTGSSQPTEFLTSLLGVSRNTWQPAKNFISEDEYWPEYWIRVKENISNDVTILTSVNPFKLSSFKKLANLPDFIWDFIPPGGHAIVIVGYNESNSSICYNDPASALFGYPEYGTYAWMNIEEFNEAVSESIGANYVILTFKKIRDPLSKQEAFNRSHARNIERLKGNLSAYDELYINMFPDSKFGINGSKLLKKHFDKGIKNRFNTIYSYKLKGKLGIFYRLSELSGPIVVKILNIPIDYSKMTHLDSFKAISYEKIYTANFLRNNTNLYYYNCEEAELFEQESKLWNKIASCYSIFMKKGIFLSIPRAIFLTIKMNSYMSQIIEIEEEMINFGAE